MKRTDQQTLTSLRNKMRRTREALGNAQSQGEATDLIRRFDNQRAELRHVTHCTTPVVCDWHV